jgi:hypothetical protein
MLLKHLEKRPRVLMTLETLEAEPVIEKTHTLVVRVVNFQKNKPIKNVTVQVFRLEKEPITLKQWGENLKNGTPFKRLMSSITTDDDGNATAELAEGDYEVKVEKYDLSKICELNQNDSVLFTVPREHWWQ